MLLLLSWRRMADRCIGQEGCTGYAEVTDNRHRIVEDTAHGFHVFLSKLPWLGIRQELVSYAGHVHHAGIALRGNGTHSGP